MQAGRTECQRGCLARRTAVVQQREAEDPRRASSRSARPRLEWQDSPPVATGASPWAALHTLVQACREGAGSVVRVRRGQTVRLSDTAETDYDEILRERSRFGKAQAIDGNLSRLCPAWSVGRTSSVRRGWIGAGLTRCSGRRTALGTDNRCTGTRRGDGPRAACAAGRIGGGMTGRPHDGSRPTSQDSAVIAASISSRDRSRPIIRSRHIQRSRQGRCVP